jgi:hypothetical protein
VRVWVLLGILVLAELYVFARIPLALLSGSVPLNPLGWFGYSEFLELSVERRSAPAAYWLVLVSLSALVVVFGIFIYAVARSVG